MQNHNPPSGFFVNRTGAAHCDDDWQMSSFDIFSSSHSFRTTNSAVDIPYNRPHVGVSPSFKRTSCSIPGRWGGIRSANTLLNNGRNSWYCSGTISSRGPSFKFFASIALLISCRDASNTVSFPLFTVQRKEAPLRITIFPRNSLWGRIWGWNISLTQYTSSGRSSVTPCTVTGASWHWILQ